MRLEEEMQCDFVCDLAKMLYRMKQVVEFKIIPSLLDHFNFLYCQFMF
jgi:hypothetical protein